MCLNFVIMVKEYNPLLSVEHPYMQKNPFKENEELSFKNIKYFNLTSKGVLSIGYFLIYYSFNCGCPNEYCRVYFFHNNLSTMFNYSCMKMESIFMCLFAVS